MKYLTMLALLLMPFSAMAEDLYADAAYDIIAAGHSLDRLGLFPATAGNLSVKVGTDLFAITVSGTHKAALKGEDVILVDEAGVAVNSGKMPSAETALHLLVYRNIPDAGAVVHTHSLYGTLLSRWIAPAEALVTRGYEIHKAFRGITTHESTLVLPIFENSQDYTALCDEIDAYLADHPDCYGFFLRDHGLYTWGATMREAVVRTEAFEFLFLCEWNLHR